MLKLRHLTKGLGLVPRFYIIAGVIGAVAGAAAGIGQAVASSNASKRAAKSQAEALRSQEAAQEEQLDFQKSQYDDWQSVYGPVRENLASLYMDLTPETFAASGLAKLDQEYQQQFDDFERQFAQRGIDSPTQDMLQGSMALQHSRDSANVRQQAPLQVAGVQQNFLNQNVTNPAASGVANALGNTANLYGNQANFYGQQQRYYDQATANAVSGIGSSLAGGIATVTGLGGLSGVGGTQGSTGNVTTLGLSGQYPSAATAITPNFGGPY